MNGSMGFLERVWLIGTLLLAIRVQSSRGSATSGVYFVRSPQPIVAPPGDRVVFECGTNVPAERIVWLHNQVEHSVSNLNSSRTSSGRRPGGQAEESGRLDLEDSPKATVHLAIRINKNPQRFRQQAGDYQCVAWFGAVALTSLPARLSIANLGDFPHLEQFNFSDFGTSRPAISTKSRENQLASDSTVYALETFTGETIVVPCPPPPSDPPATITFYKDGNRVLENERIRLLPSGNLHILNGSQSDDGQYTCTAANHITAEVIDSKRILRVSVKNPTRSKGLTFLWRPQERYIAQIGQNATLECAASGWPRPTVRWIREGNRALPVGRSFPLGAGALLLTNLSQQDQGGYMCEVSNGVGPPLKGSTWLQLTEPVSLIKTPKDSRIEEGATVALDCLAKGQPPPQHSWVFNGKPVVNDSHVIISENQLIIVNATKKHAGIYQCFVWNSLSKVDGSAATLEVLPRPQVAPFQDGDDEDDPPDESDPEDVDPMTTSTPSRPLEPKIRHQVPGKGRKGKHRPREMIPPSRPNITRLTDESVMVRWSVPPNEGLPIQFFKVQYKEVDKKGTRWKTIDEDIPSHIRSYEVTGLKAAQAYRFRIAAVYSNNDNNLGPNSGKFVLEKEAPKRKPAFSPLIDVAEAVSQSAIMIQWKYPDMDAIPLEGFFIYYRSTASAGDYTKVTVLGSNTRSHIVTHLLPETHYDLKIQAFNMQGTSEFSKIVTAKTLGSTLSNPSSTHRSHATNSNQRESHNNLDVVNSESPVTNDTLYVVLGSVLGGLTVLVVLLVALYQCRQRTGHSGHNHSVWNDINGLNSKAIAENGNVITASPNHQYHHKMPNGHSTNYAAQHEPLYVEHIQQEEDETAETSFCNDGNLSLNQRSAPVSTDSLSESGRPLSRTFVRNGGPAALVLPHSRKMGENNTSTLPLLRHNGIRDPCLDDADWEASVPAADSEKFI